MNARPVPRGARETDTTLVVQPQVTFGQLSIALARLGWRRGHDALAAPPIIPDEPEFASWLAGVGDAQISYTFNPVIHLRVLVFYGERASSHRAEVSDALPELGLAELRRLLESGDPRTLLLGIFAARELRALDTIDLLDTLRGHSHERVGAAARDAHAELLPLWLVAGAEKLKEQKRRHPERSVLFPHLGDAQTRCQTLRWLIHDYRKSNEHIDAVIRSGLVDEDWEVRATAMVAAVRLGARSVVADVERAELVRARDELDDADRTTLGRAQKLAVAHLLDRSTDDDGERGHLLRCLLGQPVENRDRVFALINSLGEPLEAEDEPPAST